ncbi:MAG TPA: DUF1850 domain-containing protein [Thermomicrobiales bacterium]|nr:DUF1850 domain-containing protein [Thermomicrobiales bacterium]
MLIRRMLWLPAATLVAMALLGIALQPATRLTVTTDDGRVLVCEQMAPGDTVTLVFTHSMYGVEVRESWRVVNGRLVRTGIETDRAAAAEYYATDGAVERTDGGFAVISPPLTVDALVVRVDQIGRHRLRSDGTDEISLADRVEGSAAVTIQTRHQALLQQGIAGCRG